LYFDGSDAMVYESIESCNHVTVCNHCLLRDDGRHGTSTKQARPTVVGIKKKRENGSVDTKVD